MLFVAEGCTPTLNRRSVKPAMLACTAMTTVCRDWPSAGIVKQVPTPPARGSEVTMGAASFILARGPAPMVRAANVQIALLMRPTLYPRELPHVRSVVLARTLTSCLAPRRVKHV